MKRGFNSYFFTLQSQEQERSRRRTANRRLTRWVLGVVITVTIAVIVML